jgi:hypothetical protein
MRLRLALGPVLVLLLIVATTTGTTTATQPLVASSAVRTYSPLRLSIVARATEASLREPASGPAAAAPVPLATLEDPGTPPVPASVHRSQPEAAIGVVVKAPPRPRPERYAARTAHALRGAASWYCNRSASRGPISPCPSAYPDTGGFDAYAAAGPRLRAALGSGWRGRVVSVDGLRVKLVDWCQCYEGQSNEKVIDVYRDVYGIVGGSVTIRW